MEVVEGEGSVVSKGEDAETVGGGPRVESVGGGDQGVKDKDEDSGAERAALFGAVVYGEGEEGEGEWAEGGGGKDVGEKAGDEVKVVVGEPEVLQEGEDKFVCH